MNPLLAAILLTVPLPTADVAAGVGIASNPFELPADPDATGGAASERRGGFFSFDARAHWRSRPAVVRLAAEGDLTTVHFGVVSRDPAASSQPKPADLDRSDGGVSLPIVVSPSTSARNVLAFSASVEPFASFHRETFTSHRTGEPVIVRNPAPDPADSDEIVNLARRYDTNEWGAGAELATEMGRTAEIILGGRATQVDHLADYRAQATVDSWDHVELRGDLDIIAMPGDLLFAAGYTIRLLDYEERFPHDASGEEVRPADPGFRAQQFTYHHGTARAGVIGPRGRVILRWRGSRRIDTYSGYLDYTENRVSADLRLRLDRANAEMRIEPSYSVRQYDRLRVRYDPDEPLSSRRRVGIEGQVEWAGFSRSTRFFLSTQVVSQRSTNPLYTYVDARGLTGIRLRFR